MSEKIKIDFHILKDEEPHSYLPRLAEKIYMKQSSALILTANLAQSQEIDNLLWVYRDTSFLPHHIANDKEDSGPILISHEYLSENQQVLINLTDSIPSFYPKFMHIIELVHGPEELRNLSRQKYKQYQTLGCQVHTFHIAHNNNNCPSPP